MNGASALSVLAALLLTSVCFSVTLTTGEDSRPEVRSEVKNNDKDNEGMVPIDGLSVSGGPHLVYEVGTRRSRSSAFMEDEDVMAVDDDVAVDDDPRVKRQVDEANAPPYLERCGRMLTLASTEFREMQPLHYALAYNTKDNGYLLVYDSGIAEFDLPLRVIGVAFNPLCITNPGTKIGQQLLSIRGSTRFIVYQGWPAVAYNPNRNSYLVLFQIGNLKSFMLVGQKIVVKEAEMKLDGPLFRAFEFVRRGKRLSVTGAAVIYSPQTRGYAMAAEVKVFSFTNIFMGCLDTGGGVGSYLRVYAYRSSSAYNPELVYDHANDLVFIIATADRGALTSKRVVTSPCVNTGDRFVILVTKATTRCRLADSWKQSIAIGSSTLRFPRVQAVWDKTARVLIVAWDTVDSNTQKQVSRMVIVDGQNILCDSFQCPSSNSIYGVSFLYHPHCNKTVGVWQQKEENQWFIGGSHFPAKFVSRVSHNHNETRPSLMYNAVDDRLIAVWKDRTWNSTEIRAHCLCSQPEVPCSVVGGPSENDTLDVSRAAESINNFLVTGTVGNESSCGDLLCYIFKSVVILHGSFLRHNSLFREQQSLHLCMPRPLCCPQLVDGVKYFVIGSAATAQLMIPAGEGQVEVWSAEREREIRAIISSW